MTDGIYGILDHIRIAGLSSAPHSPAAPPIIPSLSVHTVAPTPEHTAEYNPLFGSNPKTRGRYVATLQHNGDFVLDQC